jgi:hypothetical protein
MQRRVFGAAIALLAMALAKPSQAAPAKVFFCGVESNLDQPYCHAVTPAKGGIPFDVTGANPQVPYGWTVRGYGFAGGTATCKGAMPLTHVEWLRTPNCNFAGKKRQTLPQKKP